MDAIKTSSTSASTAEAEPVVLRDGKATRLVFKPVIVQNQSNPEASVNGSLVYQRKGPKDEWEDIKGLNLSTLKKGEGYTLELHAAEVLLLYKAIADLFSIHRTQGVPMGDQTFVQIEQTLERMLGLDDAELGLHAVPSRNALGRLLKWAVDRQDLDEVLTELERDTPAALHAVSTAAGVAALRGVLAIWEENRENNDEEFWQKVLVENPILLEQLFAYPVMVVKGKAYVGGKSAMNTGGNIADFLLRNPLTSNAALVEIKTPVTSLLGSEYRNNIFNISQELSGAVMQVLTYRKQLGEEILQLARGLTNPLDACEPECLIIIGRAETELDATHKQQAFSLFRRQLAGVKIVTFDEMFARAARLLQLFATPLEEASEDSPPLVEDWSVDDDIPF